MPLPLFGGGATKEKSPNILGDGKFKKHIDKRANAVYNNSEEAPMTVASQDMIIRNNR